MLADLSSAPPFLRVTNRVSRRFAVKDLESVYGRLSALSPDGRAIALPLHVRPTGEAAWDLLVFRKKDKAIRASGPPVTEMFWSPSGKRLAAIRVDTTGISALHILSISTGRSYRVLPGTMRALWSRDERSLIAATWSSKGRVLAWNDARGEGPHNEVVTRDGRPAVLSLFRVDVNRLTATRIGIESATRALFGGDGPTLRSWTARLVQPNTSISDSASGRFLVDGIGISRVDGAIVRITDAIVSASGVSHHAIERNEEAGGPVRRTLTRSGTLAYTASGSLHEGRKDGLFGAGWIVEVIAPKSGRSRSFNLDLPIGDYSVR